MAGIGESAPPDPGSVPKAEIPPVAVSAPPQPDQTPPAVPVPTPEKEGFVPQKNHIAAVKNAREKATAETVQKFQAQYAPHVQLGQQIQAAPVETIVGLVNELAANPDYEAQVISALARTLSARRGRTQPDSTEPQADLQTADGQTRVYSAEQQARREAWLKTQWLQEVDQRLGPIQQREQQHQASERLTAATKDANDRMAKVIAPFQAMPEYATNRPAIAEKTQAFLAAGHDPQTALGLAVATVLREVVLPSRTAQSQDELRAEAVRKSTGSTHAPGAAPATPSARPQSMLESFRQIKL